MEHALVGTNITTQTLKFVKFAIILAKLVQTLIPFKNVHLALTKAQHLE